jgi:hypothetical protein
MLTLDTKRGSPTITNSMQMEQLRKLILSLSVKLVTGELLSQYVIHMLSFT